MSGIETTASHDATFVDGLRALADLLEKHPEHAGGYYAFELFVADAEEMAFVRRQIGGHWKKEAFGDYFSLTRNLGGGVHVYIISHRANVCERVQTGTQTVERPDPEKVAEIPTVKVEEPVYEWVCPESLLADAHEQVA